MKTAYRAFLRRGTRLAGPALLAAMTVLSQQPPIEGLAHVGFRVSDMQKARAFYTGVLGYEEAFVIAGGPQGAPLHYFKINDDQYIELSPGLAADQDVRLVRIALYSSNIESLHAMLTAAGLAPARPGPLPGGNRGFSLKDPGGQELLFLQYGRESEQARARGRFLTDRRISTRLAHTGVTVSDEAVAHAFYRDKLKLREIWRGGPEGGPVRWVNMTLPAGRGDYLEYMLHDKPPTRSQLGSMHHICLEVDDIQAAYKVAVARGLATTPRHEPTIGRNRRWLLNMFDADGTRTELMEPKAVK